MKNKKHIGIMLGIILMIVPATAGMTVANEWNLRINANAGGNTYCYIGEKTVASNGVDQFDVPWPPFFPPGRAFVFLKEPSFQTPYETLMYEYKKCPGESNIFNLSTYYYPIGENGALVTLTWDNTLYSSGYRYVFLSLNGETLLDMKRVFSYGFWSNPYQITQFKIVCGPRMSLSFFELY